MDKEFLQNKDDLNDNQALKKNADYLWSIDLEKLKKETGLSINEIADLAGYKNPKGVYNWNKGKDDSGARPSFNTFVKLFEAGATVETLFGVDYKSTPISADSSLKLSDQEIIDGLQRALAALSKKSQ